MDGAGDGDGKAVGGRDDEKSASYCFCNSATDGLAGKAINTPARRSFNINTTGYLLNKTTSL